MIKIPQALLGLLACVIGILMSSGAVAADSDIVVVGGEGADCIEDIRLGGHCLSSGHIVFGIDLPMTQP